MRQFLARAGLAAIYDIFEGCERHRASDLMLGYRPGEWWQHVEADELVWACRVASSDTNEVATVAVAPERFGCPLPDPKLSRALIGGKAVQHGEPPWDVYRPPGPPPPPF